MWIDDRQTSKCSRNRSSTRFQSMGGRDDAISTSTVTDLDFRRGVVLSKCGSDAATSNGDRLGRSGCSVGCTGLL